MKKTFIPNLGPSKIKYIVRGDVLKITDKSNLSEINANIDDSKNSELQLGNFSKEKRALVTSSFGKLKGEFKAKWLKAQRKPKDFMKNNHSWITGYFSIPSAVSCAGRPVKRFEESSARTQRRKTEDLRKSNDTRVLVAATQIKLDTDGKRNAAEILKNITSSPNRAHKYKVAYQQSQSNSKCTGRLPVLKALSMFVEGNLTRKQYEVVRMSHGKYYPCYSYLQEAKKDCYPPPGLSKLLLPVLR